MTSDTELIHRLYVHTQFVPSIFLLNIKSNQSFITWHVSCINYRKVSHRGQK